MVELEELVELERSNFDALTFDSCNNLNKRLGFL